MMPSLPSPSLSHPAADRFDASSCTVTMKAVVTKAAGGFDQLEYRDVPIPTDLRDSDVLVHVLAAGVNNTEINTRLGWYSAEVTKGTDDLIDDTDEKVRSERTGDGGWNQATLFPFIQGTDCCGRVVAVGSKAATSLLRSRVIVRPCVRTKGWDSVETTWMASDFDGAFAQFVRVAANDVFPVDCTWSDAELGSVPCAYGTAENLLTRARVNSDDTVLITGASGGVASAAVQLAKRRRATVIAVTSAPKIGQIEALGADRVIDRSQDVLSVLGENSVHVVLDMVAGTAFPDMLKALRFGGRFVTAGAIAGPLVQLDMRTLYLKDLTLIGSTAWQREVFPNLVSYIERGEIKPLLSKTFPLKEIVEAQKEFLTKQHIGKFVMLPPPLTKEQTAFLDKLSRHIPT